MSENKKIIEKLKKQDLSNENTLNDLLDMCVYVKEEDLDYSIDTAQIVKRESAKNVRYNADLEDIYYRALLFLAPYDFDSYLIYMEKDREPKTRFYLPRRKQLRAIGVIQELQNLECGDLETLSISMPPGTAKAQPLYSKVLTPNGFKRMGDIKVGDSVITPKGKISSVIGVFPQGKKPVYELTFDDGSKCRCSDEHLWTVQSRSDRQYKNRTGKDRYRTIELKEMMSNIRIGSEKRCNYSIDYVGKINFERKAEHFLNPYVVGVLIGDGSLSCGCVKLSNADEELLSKFEKLLPYGFELHKIPGENVDYNVVNTNHVKGNNKKGKIRVELERIGLYGKRSFEKGIPKEYLYTSRKERIELLNGLMDTDGTTDGKICVYSTSSLKLSEDVQLLVHSLGGYASIKKSKAGYRDKNGKYVECRDCYKVTIQFSKNGINPFSLSRKKDTYSPKRSEIKRFITNVEYVAEEECQCIYIDDEEHLYITDDYIITHNTTLEEFFVSWIIGRDVDGYSLFASHSGDITRMFYDSINDITSSSEYKWGEIFPNAKRESENAKTEQINWGKYKPFKTIQCTSVGSKNAGKVRCNRYLFCDDLIGGIEEALSKPRLDKLWNTYSVDLRQRKKDGCKELHIATRWSVHDVIGRLITKFSGSDKAKFISVPDINPETGESNFEYDYGVGFSKEYFKDMEDTMDDISYKCLYKSVAIEREGLLYHEDDLRRFASLPQKEPDAVLGICDTKDKGTDFMFLPCMYQYGNDFYMVDCICDDNADYGIQYNRCADIIVNNKMQQCQFESNNGGSRVGYEVNKIVESKGGRCNITDKTTTQNKETKIIVNADWVKKHVLFREKEDYKPKSDYGKAMSWLLCYSLVGKTLHDDVPDGLAQFALYVQDLYGTNTQSRVINSPW